MEKGPQDCPLTLLAVEVGAEEQGRTPKLAEVSRGIQPTECRLPGPCEVG